MSPHNFTYSPCKDPNSCKVHNNLSILYYNHTLNIILTCIRMSLKLSDSITFIQQLQKSTCTHRQVVPSSLSFLTNFGRTLSRCGSFRSREIVWVLHVSCVLNAPHEGNSTGVVATYAIRPISSSSIIIMQAQLYTEASASGADLSDMST